MNSIQASSKIIELHNGIMVSARRSVEDAIKIGEIISEQKQLLKHGEFLPWVETLPFTDKTAQSYLKLYKYKIENVSNLQDAYKKVETLEKQERQSEQERKRSLISEYRKTGIKPHGWDRSLDYEMEKQKKEEIKRKESIEKEKEQRYNRTQEREKENNASDLFSDALNQATSEYFEKRKELDSWKAKIRLSDSGKDDSFQSAIIEYLTTLENDNRRIEACQNIIKICRNISVELQTIKESNNEK